MTRVTERLLVELSGENPSLAQAELDAVVRTLSSGSKPPQSSSWGPGFRYVEEVSGDALVSRLALAHRVLAFRDEGDLSALASVLAQEGGRHRSAAVRLAGEVPRELHRTLPQQLGKAFVEGGGRIDLSHPDQTFVVIPNRVEGTWGLFEERAKVARSSFEDRRSPKLPFSKPITLPPRLARAVVNLAEVQPGGRLLDPFCGTGALLAEGGLLGCRVMGADIDGAMVRGALANLAYLGVTPEAVVQADVADLPGSPALRLPAEGLVADPPYGRSASTRGETTREVVGKLIEALPRLIRSRAVAVVLLPSPDLVPLLPPGVTLVGDPVPQRVHRSLTRWVTRWRRD